MLTENLTYKTELGVVANSTVMGMEPPSIEFQMNVASILRKAIGKPLEGLNSYSAQMVKSGNLLFADIRKSPMKRFVDRGPNYAVMSNVPFASPEHSTAPLTTYIEVITRIHKELSETLPGALNDLKSSVAILSTNKGEESIKTNYKSVLDVDKSTRLLKTVANQERSYDNQLYKKLIRRNKDWLEIDDSLKELCKVSNSFDFDKLLKDTIDLNKNITHLIETKLEKSSKHNGPTLKALGLAVHEVSQAISLCGLIASMIIELTELYPVWSKRLRSLI